VTVAAVVIDESSLPQRALTPREFQTTMHFLLGFVKKDKQADGLFERLLMRLGLAQTSTQRRNLSFCISELPVSVKGLKKLVELFKHIKDSLHDPQVRIIECKVIKNDKYCNKINVYYNQLLDSS
jgi:condensin complex subunit 1